MNPGRGLFSPSRSKDKSGVRLVDYSKLTLGGKVSVNGSYSMCLPSKRLVTCPGVLTLQHMGWAPLPLSDLVGLQMDEWFKILKENSREKSGDMFALPLET